MFLLDTHNVYEIRKEKPYRSASNLDVCKQQQQRTVKIIHCVKEVYVQFLGHEFERVIDFKNFSELEFNEHQQQILLQSRLKVRKS